MSNDKSNTDTKHKVDPEFTKRFREWSEEICRKEGIDLKDMIDHFGFSFRIGVLNNYRAGRNEPMAKVLKELKEKIPSLDLNWLLCGTPHNKAEEALEGLVEKSIGKGKLRAKYIKLKDTFNEPISAEAFALYRDVDSFKSDGMYVVEINNSGIPLVRDVAYKSNGVYEIVAGKSSNRSSFDITDSEIKFLGKVIAIMQKSAEE